MARRYPAAGVGFNVAVAPRRRERRRRVVALVAAEAVAVGGLAAAGVLPRWPGLVGAAALPPLDLGLDLRLLVTLAPSYPVFAAGCLASVAVRSAGLAWATGERWGRTLRLYLAAWPPLAVAASLVHAGAAALFHWFVWLGLLVGAATALVGARRWGWGRAAAALAALVAAGVAARGAGTWGGVGMLAAGAVPTVVVLGGAPRTRRVALPVMLAGVLAAPPAGVPAPGAAGGERLRPVLLLVPGADTATGRGALWRFDPRAVGLGCGDTFYFSYRGPGHVPLRARGEARCPVRLHRPYRRADTQQPMARLVEGLAAHLRAVHEAAGPRPVVVLTHSQGAWFAWRAVAGGRAPGVSALVLLGPHPDSPVGFPPPGRGGPGRVGADATRALLRLLTATGVSTYRLDAPPGSLVGARPGELAGLFARPLPPGVRALHLFPLSDAVVHTWGWRLPHAQNVAVAATHTGIVTHPAAMAAVRSFLAGRPPPGGPEVAAALLEGVGATLGAPQRRR